MSAYYASPGWPGRGDRPGGTRAGPGRVRGPGLAVTPDRADPGPDGHPARRRAVGAGHRRLRGGDHRLVRRLVHRAAAGLRGRLPDRLRALADPGVRLRDPAHRRVSAVHAGGRGLPDPGRGAAGPAEPAGRPVPVLPADPGLDRRRGGELRRVHPRPVRELADRADLGPDAGCPVPGAGRRAAVPDPGLRVRVHADQRVSLGAVRRPDGGRDGRAAAGVRRRSPAYGAQPGYGAAAGIGQQPGYGAAAGVRAGAGVRRAAGIWPAGGVRAAAGVWRAAGGGDGVWLVVAGPVQQGQDAGDRRSSCSAWYSRPRKGSSRRRSPTTWSAPRRPSTSCRATSPR